MGEVTLFCSRQFGLPMSKGSGERESSGQSICGVFECERNEIDGTTHDQDAIEAQDDAVGATAVPREPVNA
jgi:hypothetical protein